ncbi:hypothetical protein VM1G_04613 [Cytospora mali]|uniref:DUF7730 domain-containing protein n=1 Tax=Cytospora mali TaxID=578113 RepID=A0A194VYI8_CYTMA|nr:hypothetical protein VM1G_04613 [Valsa mali]
MPSLRAGIAATAHPQTSSPFFEKLPFEIREKIYDELWQMHPTRWHVHTPGHHCIPVFPCITDADEEDVRYANFKASRGNDAVEWESRLRSPWNTHWRCAEAAATRASGSSRKRIPSANDYIRFTPRYARPLEEGSPLFVCKRMYLEAVDRLDNILTFSFTDIIVARDFLAKFPHRTIRNIQISLRVKPIITELYFTGPDGEPQPHIGGSVVTTKNNPWEDLCRRLSAMPSLRQLHLYLDSEDLRPWHKRVNERRFFEQLFQARALNYVLNLPEIPADPERQGLPGSYLDDAEELEKAPFQIRRGPRPNNWQLHLSRVSLLQLIRHH